jgi:hypothetical protein
MTTIYPNNPSPTFNEWVNHIKTERKRLEKANKPQSHTVWHTIKLEWFNALRIRNSFSNPQIKEQ